MILWDKSTFNEIIKNAPKLRKAKRLNSVFEIRSLIQRFIETEMDLFSIIGLSDFCFFKKGPCTQLGVSSALQSCSVVL